MKSLFLAVSLTLTASFAVAAPCSPGSKDPCTPVKGEETDADKEEILLYIEKAQKAEPDVKKKYATYLELRRIDGQAPEDLAAKERRFKIFAAYADAKRAQDALYEEAIRLTSKLYNVWPDHQDEITIGEPDDAHMKYMTGLKAKWRPEVTDSGPGVKLAVKVDAADRPHYSGGTKMNPLDPKGRLAVTLPDGRVLILKDTFILAVDKKNLGFLAQAIYHETRHFNRLSWTDDQGRNRSWPTADEEERDAYKATILIGKRIFGLTVDDMKELNSQYKDFDNAVKTGVPLSDDRLTPQQEEAWKTHYEKNQINLEEHFEALEQDVVSETARQLALQNRQREERERLEREERERLARYEEKVRRERELLGINMSELAARCGYELDYVSKQDQTIIGFHDSRDPHFFKDRALPETLDDFDLMLAVSRACDDAEADHSRKKGIKACNGAPARLRSEYNADRFRGFPGIRAANQINSECTNHVLDDMMKYDKPRSIEESIRSYQQILRKKDAAKQRNDEIEENLRKLRDRKKENPPRDDDRTTPPDNDKDCFRNGDPFGCEHKR